MREGAYDYLPAENLLLRHQLVVLRRSSPRPRLRRLDRWLIATRRCHARTVARLNLRSSSVSTRGRVSRHLSQQRAYVARLELAPLVPFR
jgi:hypothetical protein